jgi:hypothetical protein
MRPCETKFIDTALITVLDRPHFVSVDAMFRDVLGCPVSEASVASWAVMVSPELSHVLSFFVIDMLAEMSTFSFCGEERPLRVSAPNA